MANVRIKDITTTASAPNDDDYLAIDGATAGTRKISAANLNGDTLTTDIKDALLQIASKVAYIDDQGQTYYDDLYDALYPPAVLVSITAAYTQSGTIYDSDSLDILKADLVVSGLFSDNSTRIIPDTDYELSGTLTTGESVITVSVEDKTTTFTVTVTHAEQVFDIENSLTNCTSTNSTTRIGQGESYSATITADSGNILMTVTVTMGGEDITSTAYSNGVINISSVSGDITIYAYAAVITVVQATWETGGLGGTGRKVSYDANRYQNYVVTNYIPMTKNQTLVLYNTNPAWTNKHTYNGTDYINCNAVFYQVAGTDGADDGSYIYPGIGYSTEGNFFMFKSDETVVANYSKTVAVRLSAYNMNGFTDTAVVGIIDGV